MKREKKTLGVLGGMGPMATVQFYRLLTSRTKALHDEEHLNIIITSRADTPDRTDYIMGKSDRSPLPAMIADAKTLEAAGAGLIAIPCNTACHFHAELQDAVSIPILDIVRETSYHVSKRGFHRAAVLATDGTLKTGSYRRALAEVGVDAVEPDPETQSLISEIIYDYVKAGKEGGEVLFVKVAERMFSRGCDCLILGCTELPLAAPSDTNIIDSLEVLAYRAIVKCGGVPTGFTHEFLSAYEN